MPALHALDKLITDTWPDLSSDALLHAFEATPYAERIAAPSTYEALRRGAAINWPWLMVSGASSGSALGRK